MQEYINKKTKRSNNIQKFPIICNKTQGLQEDNIIGNLSSSRREPEIVDDNDRAIYSLVTPQTAIVPFNDYLEIYCNSDTDIEWKHEGSHLPEDIKIERNNFYSMLIIPKMNTSHVGNYFCLTSEKGVKVYDMCSVTITGTNLLILLMQYNFKSGVGGCSKIKVGT